MSELKLTDLQKRYGSVAAVDSVDLHVAEHEFLTLLGPSGSGKTTVLRLIAGYIEPDGGSITLGEREVSGLPPEKRDIGMVFQNYALFPHMNVFENVAFGLDRRHVPRAERNVRIAEALASVRLEGLEKRLPRQLSGGQQRRVALARAIVIRPTLLLLDEPLSNLDAKLRGEVRLEIRNLQRRIGITTILVTHDQEEALTVSDRIAVMNHGRIEQVATPAELYHRPVNRFVADFVGRTNFLAIEKTSPSGDGLGSYRLSDGTAIRAPSDCDRGQLVLRPEALRFGPAPDPIEANTLTGHLEYRVLLGELVEFGLRLKSGDLLVVRLSNTEPVEAGVGDELCCWWPVTGASVFAEGEPGKR